MWSTKDRREALDYLNLNALLGFLSFVSVFLSYYILEILIGMARSIEQNMQLFHRKYRIMFCSILHVVLGLLNFAMCYKMNANASYSSSFIVQQICCTSASLSIAYMQWYFRNACNTHILRIVVIMNICQFIQEIAFAYSTYMLIMVMGRKSDIKPNELNSLNETEVLHLLIGNILIHGIRLIIYAYPVAIFAGKAFLAEILCRIRFFANRRRGISSEQAKQAKKAASYFFLSLGLVILSVKSIIFCFRTITNHTPLYTQPISIMVPLHRLINLGYILIAVVIIEILFTIIMYQVFSIKVDFVLGTELFLWINSISTSLLQIWICRHERFQRCVIILIIELISNCFKIFLLIMVEEEIVQTIIAVMTRYNKILPHATARIVYIVVDHVLQIIQWALNICSLGLALIVLDGVEIEEDDFSDGTDNPTIDLTNELFNAPNFREHLITECISETNRTNCCISEINRTSCCIPETDPADCSIFNRLADKNYMWSESHVSFADEIAEGGNNTNKNDSNSKIIENFTNKNKDDDSISGNSNSVTERNSSNNNETESDAVEKSVDSSGSDNDNDTYVDNVDSTM
ncbi:unnamed protein product [Cercopithifilaria johnstoni]|uniref:Uncharacterized protein n=1 Tax=Cercopithifilaria johnstoni TaxID=2874296 RepID=A0A8J2M9H1_9BILA|nr:unnamed protein product [Cercopithifilaria johnstoni]